MCAYITIVVAEVDTQHGHGTNDGDQRLDRVTVDDWLELLVVFTRETAFVDDSASVTSPHVSRHGHSIQATALQIWRR